MHLHDLPPLSPSEALLPLPDSALSALWGVPPELSPPHPARSPPTEQQTSQRQRQGQQQQQQQQQGLLSVMEQARALPPLPEDALASFLGSHAHASPLNARHNTDPACTYTKAIEGGPCSSLLACASRLVPAHHGGAHQETLDAGGKPPSPTERGDAGGAESLGGSHASGLLTPRSVPHRQCSSSSSSIRRQRSSNRSSEEVKAPESPFAMFSG